MTAQKKGFSLAEAVVAIFLLTAGFVVVVRLFGAAIRYSTQVSAHSTASLLALRRLEEVRAFNQANHRPAGSAMDFDQWPGIDNSVISYPEWPDFQVVTHIRVPGTTPAGLAPVASVFSPCSLFEALYPPPAPLDPTFQQPRTMNSAVRKVVVSVQDRRGTAYATVYSLIGLPQVLGSHTPAWWDSQFQVNVRFRGPGASSLAHNQSVDLEAQVVDTASGQSVPGPCFNWLVAGPTWGSSSDGFGTVNQARDGSWCRFTHQLNEGSTTSYAPGTCYLWAVAWFQGQALKGHSSAIVTQ